MPRRQKGGRVRRINATRLAYAEILVLALCFGLVRSLFLRDGYLQLKRLSFQWKLVLNPFTPKKTSLNSQQ